jgi:hypothetical protein
MDANDLKQQLDRLAARLARIEQVLNLPSQQDASSKIDRDMAKTSDAAPPVSPPVIATQAETSEASTSQINIKPPEKSGAFQRLAQTWDEDNSSEANAWGMPAPKAPAPPVATTPLPSQLSVSTAPPILGPTTPPQSRDEPLANVRRFAVNQPRDERDDSSASRSLEMLIGGKWMAWVGALIVLLAVAFAIMVGVEQGWWSKLPPTIRCLTIAAFGIVLMIGGEVALRRVGKAASVGLFSAGLGTLYLDSFAAFKPFNLISELGAFPLLSLVALIGFAITLRTSFLTIGVLSLVGGYLAPLLLWDSSAQTMRVPMHLTMLFGIALGLSAFKSAPFRALRWVAMGGQLLIGLIWIVSAGPVVWKIAMVFMSIWAVMLLVEVIYDAIREQSATGNVAISVLGTAAFVTAGCWLLNRFQPAGVNWMGMFTLAVGVLYAVAALQFGPGLDALRGRTRTAMDKLAVGLWIQAGILLAVAIALHFDGFGQSIGWLVVGLGAIEAGRRLPSGGLTRFGVIVGALAVARVSFADWWPRSMRAVLSEFAGVQINRWAILTLATILIMHVAAKRIRVMTPHRVARIPLIVATLGVALWMVLWAVQAQGLSTTASWLLGAVVLLGLERFGRREKYFELSLVVLAAATVRWLAIDAVANRINPGWSALKSTPFINAQMGLAVAICAVAYWAYRVMRSREALGQSQLAANVQTGWQLIVAIGATIALIALSFEADRSVEQIAALNQGVWWSVEHVRQLILTILWTVGGSSIGIVAMLARRNANDQRARPSFLVHFAWTLLALCAIKWVVVDTLLFTLVNRSTQVTGFLPIGNLQMLAGGLLAIAAIVLRALAPAILEDDDGASYGQSTTLAASQRLLVGAALVILWGLTFEIDRALSRVQSLPEWLDIWPAAQMRSLWWTMLWSTGGMAIVLIGRWRRFSIMQIDGAVVTAAAAIAWLTYGTLLWRLQSGIILAPPIMNLQFVAGAVAAAMLGIQLRFLAILPLDDVSLIDRRRTTSLGAAVIIAAIGLWLGTLEIDRFFADQFMEKQTALSVFWGLYGALLVSIGFFKRAPAARYAGMAMLGITLVKAFAVDMRELELVWKALIFFVIGMLLIGVSIAYVRLAPRLLRAESDE